MFRCPGYEGRAAPVLRLGRRRCDGWPPRAASQAARAGAWPVTAHPHRQHGEPSRASTRPVAMSYFGYPVRRTAPAPQAWAWQNAKEGLTWAGAAGSAKMTACRSPGGRAARRSGRPGDRRMSIKHHVAVVREGGSIKHPPCPPSARVHTVADDARGEDLQRRVDMNTLQVVPTASPPAEKASVQMPRALRTRASFARTFDRGAALLLRQRGSGLCTIESFAAAKPSAVLSTGPLRVLK